MTGVAAALPLLEVRDLTASFDTERGRLRAIEGVSFDVPRGAMVGLVGESGSGKSVTSLSIMRLLPEAGARIEAGSVDFDGVDLVKLSERAMTKIRGGRIAMVFQEPMTSLNPVYTVGAQIAEAIRLHEDVSRREARARARELVAKVGIPDPDSRLDAYPHELSGGMRQRVMIAMALSCSPELLIADEPTTALDVTIQAQILDLLDELRRERGMSVLFITHDLGVIAELADRVIVMYAGRVVEAADTRELFADPRHPYTRGLLRCVPRLGSSRDGTRATRLPTIEGTVPDLLALPEGCRFGPRCPSRDARCDVEPALRELTPGHFVRCVHA